MPYIHGRNPVIEALEHQRPIQKIYIQHGNRGDKINLIFLFFKQNRIPITNADPHKIAKMVGKVTHQGVVALVSPVEIRDIADLLEAPLPENRYGLWVIADQIQDPHNMGAIIRSAEVLGADGVIFGTRDTVPITDTVVKASAGAALHCPLYTAPNLGRAVAALKEKNIWVYGSSLETDQQLWDVDCLRHCAIVIGGEGSGIRPSLAKSCDVLFKIPQPGSTQSLNASVAAGVILAETLRQRLGNPRG